MKIETAAPYGTVDVGLSYNMGTLDFTASAGASGTWNVYAVQQPVNPLSFWTHSALDDFDFTNLQNGTESSLLLGTITVVPEPGSLALGVLGAGIVTLGIRVRRNRS
jgi:hypothetical protein